MARAEDDRLACARGYQRNAHAAWQPESGAMRPRCEALGGRAEQGEPVHDALESGKADQGSGGGDRNHAQATSATEGGVEQVEQRVAERAAAGGFAQGQAE